MENLNLKSNKFKKGKTTKKKVEGITLIALVITIIVLLILAGVTIATLTGDNGILNKAQKAKEETETATDEEQDKLLRYEYETEKLLGEIDATETYGEYAMEREIKEKYGKDVKIGDTVNYKAENDYDGTWKLLGIDDGKILLISSRQVEFVKLSGKNGYLNGVKQLDEACEEYGTGEGAECARSLRVEDINRITGYNPEKTGDGKRSGFGTIGEYGNEVIFEKTSTGVKYVPVVGSSGEFIGDIFTSEGEPLESSPLKLISTAYRYTLGTCRDIKNPDYSDSRWDTLFESYRRDGPVWLANSYCYLGSLEEDDKKVNYGMRYLRPSDPNWRRTCGLSDSLLLKWERRGNSRVLVGCCRN